MKAMASIPSITSRMQCPVLHNRRISPNTKPHQTGQQTDFCRLVGEPLLHWLQFCPLDHELPDCLDSDSGHTMLQGQLGRLFRLL